MKALVISKENDLRLREIEVPKINKDEVLIRQKACGICHSDYELISGKYIVPFSYPIIPGHEWSGEVVEVGEEVTDFKRGDRVVGECVIGCGHCRLCKSGTFTNCPFADHFGFTIDGAMAEYFITRPEWLHILPDVVSFEQGALVEPFSVAYFSLTEIGCVNASDSVVIFGAGPIGLCCLAVAKGMGARTIVVEPMENRIKIAEAMDADEIINPSKEDTIKRVHELTNKGAGVVGADVVVEASGTSEVMEIIFEVARNNGRVSIPGINIGNKISVELGKIQAKGLNVKGIVGSPYIWEQALEFLARSKTNLSRMVTHIFSLSEAEKAYQFASNRDECLKVIIKA